jgi:AcrR family transcriptional regulator
MAVQQVGESFGTRYRILQIALQLMSQRGVDGTSMRDLASAAGLNVASLYHYFPSKRDLLEAVLVEEGFLPQVTDLPRDLGAMLTEILRSMFQVEDFVRLMVGEAIRGEETARSVGFDLFSAFQISIAEWVAVHRPDLEQRCGGTAVAHLLSEMVVGVFVLHASGVIDATGAELDEVLRERAREVVQLLGPPPAAA